MWGHGGARVRGREAWEACGGAGVQPSMSTIKGAAGSSATKHSHHGGLNSSGWSIQSTWHGRDRCQHVPR